MWYCKRQKWHHFLLFIYNFLYENVHFYMTFPKVTQNIQALFQVFNEGVITLFLNN